MGSCWTGFARVKGARHWKGRPVSEAIRVARRAYRVRHEAPYTEPAHWTLLRARPASAPPGPGKYDRTPAEVHTVPHLLALLHAIPDAFATEAEALRAILAEIGP